MYWLWSLADRSGLSLCTRLLLHWGQFYLSIYLAEAHSLYLQDDKWLSSTFSESPLKETIRTFLSRLVCYLPVCFVWPSCYNAMYHPSFISPPDSKPGFTLKVGTNEVGIQVGVFFKVLFSFLGRQRLSFCVSATRRSLSIEIGL
jgi:hypothetical protein